MFLLIASFVACFNIGKARDEKGKEIEIDGSYYGVGVVMYVSELKDFKGLTVYLQTQETFQVFHHSSVREDSPTHRGPRMISLIPLGWSTTLTLTTEDVLC